MATITARTGPADLNGMLRLPAMRLAMRTVALATTIAARRCCPSSRKALVDRSGRARQAYHGERQTKARMIVVGRIIAVLSAAVRDAATEISRPKIAPRGIQTAR